MTTTQNEPSINAYVGSATGLLKSVTFANKQVRNHPDEQNYGKDFAIMDMCWDNQNPKKFHMGLKNLMVKTYDVEEKQYCTTNTMPYVLQDPKDEIKTLNTLNGKFIAGMSNGDVNIWSNDNDLNTLRVGNNLECMSLLHKHNLMVTGGKENLMKVWDLNKSEKPIFTAKNVKPDWLDHRVPVWETTVHFVENSPDTILTTTGKSQIRMYDLRVGLNTNMTKKQRQFPKRRPVMETKFSEFPITTSSMVQRDPKKVYVANTRGEIGCFDLRKPKNVCKSYEPAMGCIKKLVNHPIKPYFFSVSIGGYLRVHDEKTRKPKEKVYMKAALNKLLVTSAELEDKPKETKKVGKADKFKTEEEFCKSDDEEEDEWGNMEEASDEDDESPSPKKQKLN